MFLRQTSHPVPPGDEVLTVVPTNRLARQLRKGSILSSGSKGIEPPVFHTLETLARSIYQETSKPWQLLAGPARALLFREAIQSLGESHGIRLSRGTFARMLEAITMLEEWGITADSFAKRLAKLPPHERLRLEGFLGCYRAFEKELRESHALDLPAILRHLHDELAHDEFEAAFRSTHPGIREIRFEGFSDFADPEVGFIERLKSLPEIDVSVAERISSPNPILAHRLREWPAADEKLDLSSQVTLVEARTRWQEVTTICRLIKSLAAEKPGRDLSSICVALPKPELYTEIIRERFTTYGIPANLTDRFELSRSPLVTDILGILKMPQHDFQRDDVLRLLHSPLLSFEDGIGRGTLADVSRRLRITAGFDLWLRKIDAEIHIRESRARTVKGAAGEREEDSFVAGLRKARLDIQKLEELTHGFGGDLTPREFESRVVLLLRNLNLPVRLAAAEVAGEQIERDARAYSGFVDALRELIRILQARQKGRRHAFGYYVDLLESAISAVRYNVIERTGEGVLVTGLEETRGIPVEVMILAGLEDTSIPGPAEPQMFLGEELQRIREEKRLRRSHSLFMEAATNWTDQLYLLYPLREAGVDLVRSSFLDSFLTVASVRAVSDADLSAGRETLHSEEEFLEWYVGQEREEEKGKGFLPEALREKAGRLSRGRSIERSRTVTHEQAEYEGRIGGALSSRAASVLRKFGSAPISVTDLETYGDCPFKFFTGNLLGLRAPMEFPEEVSPVERGFAIHEVLFEFYRGRQARGLPAVRELTDETFAEAVRELEEIAERRLARIDVPGPFWEMEKDWILGRSGTVPGLLHSFLLAERERTDGVQPAFFEVAFGQPGNRPGDADPVLSTPAPVTIGEVNLRGRIDRLDMGEESFVIIDYKTGNAVPTLSDIRSGASLQIPLYLYAAGKLLEQAGAPLVPAAGLYYRIRDPVELELALGSARYSGLAFVASKGSRRVLKTQAEFQSVMDAAVARANEYVAAMKRGEFPLARPEQREAVCRWCEFKAVCRVGSVREG